MKNRIYSNGPNKDFVVNPFTRMLEESEYARLAAPYFTEGKSLVDQLVRAATKGKDIQLLIGLNAATDPKALRRIRKERRIIVRYLTRRFHAKIFIFEKGALLGSANLTDGGLNSNREAVINLDHEADADAIEEMRTLFVELWDSGQVLTDNVLDVFEMSYGAYKEQNRKTPDPGKVIEDEFGAAQPHNIDVGSHAKSKERVFLETLQREVNEQYLPHFGEVADILDQQEFRRPDLADFSIEIETNRFLNYVRLTHVIGDEVWQNAPRLSTDKRRTLILGYAREWKTATDSKVPEDFAAWQRAVEETFGTREAIDEADKKQITTGLMSIHAFHARLRFVKGGLENLPTEFWKANNDNLGRVKFTLVHLLHGPGEFVERLHDVIYDSSKKLEGFGYFCALELYGTVHPDVCPPINGRMAKALRFLGFDVRAV